MHSFTSLPWFICKLFVILACGKTLAEPSVEQAKMVVTNEWLAQEITERLRDEDRHREGEMIVALSRSKPNIELPRGDLSLELTSQPSGGLR